MSFKQVEYIFNRALLYSFSKKKFLLTFPILALCGLLIVFCRALMLGASAWVTMSLTFLPFFLCTSILLSLGVLLSRIYNCEVRGIRMSYRKLFLESWELLIGISYMSLPMLLVYLMLWMVLGMFYLLGTMPGIGEFFTVVLASGPFLLVLGSILLSCLNIFSLYFLTPHVAFRSGSKKRLLEELVKRIVTNPFGNILFFLFALIPCSLVLSVLYLSASVTGATFLVNSNTIAIVMQWFFIMIPFCALMTPTLTFFFNFSVESYILLEKRRHAIEHAV